MDIFNSWIVNLPIAHRGLHGGQIPENSIEAFKKAIAAGYAIELDVQMLADDTVVVFHDYNLDRVTGIDKMVNTLRLKDLPNIKLGDSKETIPLFTDVLKLINGKVPILVEVKNEGKVGKLEETVLKMLKEYKGEYAIQAFNPFVLNYFYKNAPEIPRGQLSSYFKGEKLAFYKKFILKRMYLNKRVSHPDFITYQTENLPNRFVNRCKHLPIIAWIVKSEAEQKRVCPPCVNVIFEEYRPAIKSHQ